jgi:hypothetical protein
MGAAILARRAAATGGEAAWFDMLPATVALPTAGFAGDELEAARLPPAATAFCRAFLSVLRAAADGPLAPALTAAGVRATDRASPLVWGAALAQSRTFVVDARGTRVLAPGIDFANHAAAPTAAVRVTHSPHAAQGAAAAEEVAPPAPVGESTICLVAGAAGVAAGDAVTVSYGPHPLEALFSLYGFLPPEDAATGRDATVLFDSLADAAAAAASLASPAAVPGAPDADTLLDAMTAALAAQFKGVDQDWSGMVVAARGCDPRAVAAARAAAAALAPAFEAVGRKAPGGGDVVAAGVARLLASLTAEGPPPPATPAGALAAELVRRRVAVLRAAEAAIGSGGRK